MSEVTIEIGSDEKTCPFCAERIKAAAVKCRYCHSDLVVEEPPEPQPESGPTASNRQSVSLNGPSKSRSVRPTAGYMASPWLAAVLAAVLVTCTVLLALEVRDNHDPVQVAAEGGPLTDEQGRTAVLVAAADLSQRVLTYHHDTFDQDLEVARARMTDSFAEEYDEAMAQLRANTERNKISQESTAVASSIIDATADRAKALVFVNQESRSARSKQSQLTRNRLVITLERAGGEWLVSDVLALG